RAQGEIAANWEGQAFSRFEEQFQQLSPKVEKFAQLLEEIKQQSSKSVTYKRQSSTRKST
ncbi:WXG100 family type VII secretion target, partial [Staphylococcus sp. EG-SA-23]|uniref:WXG100 family type VII secretion target n=1 Tax=Staphylococcus sp. EG-SA-23 TaxID=2767497 RepID=UPI00197CDBA6